MRRSVSDKIAKNAAFNFAGVVWGAAVSFFLTPYIVHRIGPERYGLLALVGTIVGYAGLLDCSMDGTFAKHFSEYEAKGDFDSINRVISCGIAFYAILGGAVFAGVILFTEPILRLLNIAPRLHDEARFAVIFGGFLYVFNSVGGVFEAFVYGLQRMDLINKVNVGMTFPSLAATVGVLWEGWGIRGLLWVRAATRAATFWIYRRCARTLAPQVRPGLKWVDREMLGRLMTFGLKLHVSHIANTLTAETDKLFITMFLSVGLITDFQIGNSLVLYAISVTGMIGVTLLPAFSEIAAGGDNRRVAEAYLHGSRFLCAFAAPLFVFVAASSGPLVRFWMGSGFVDSALVAKVLAVGWFTEAVTTAGYSACIAVSRPELLAKRALIMSALDIVLNVAFIKAFGFAGAGIGTSIALASGNFYLHAKLQRELGVTPGAVRRALAPLVVLALACGALVSVFDLAAPWSAMERPSLALLLAAKGTVFCGLYALGGRLFGLFSAEEIGFIKEKIRGLTSLA